MFLTWVNSYKTRLLDVEGDKHTLLFGVYEILMYVYEIDVNLLCEQLCQVWNVLMLSKLLPTSDERKQCGKIEKVRFVVFQFFVSFILCFILIQTTKYEL